MSEPEEATEENVVVMAEHKSFRSKTSDIAGTHRTLTAPAPVTLSIEKLKEKEEPKKKKISSEMDLISKRGSKIASNMKKKSASKEINFETDKQNEKISPHPIPDTHQISSEAIAAALKSTSDVELNKTNEDEEDFVDEVVDMQSSKAKVKHDWSEEEEASGLPRQESRMSRASRAMRQFFCCGVAVSAPSETEYDDPRDEAI